MLTVICWDELVGNADIITERDAGLRGVRDLDLSITASDAEVEAFTRELLGDHDMGWQLEKLTRGSRTITLEWCSDRDHLAVTTLAWT